MKHATAIALGSALFLCIASISASAQQQPPQPQDSRVTQAPGTSKTAQPVAVRQEADHPQPAERAPRYHIMPSDTLSITFSLSPELDQAKVLVQPDGYINMPDAGSVYVKGMTTVEAGAALKRAYAGILHDPIIQVDLVDFQKPYFLVLGQVGKPGEYELRHDTTVTEGIAIAGGFAPTSKTQVLLYHRISQDWVECKKLNIKDILHGRNVNEDIHLYPGDMIFVPEKAITMFRKYIPYGTYVATTPAAY